MEKQGFGEYFKKNWFFILLISAICVVAVVLFIQAINAPEEQTADPSGLSAQQTPQTPSTATSAQSARSLTVFGSGSAQGLPDQAIIHFSAETRHAVLANARTDNQKRMNELIGLLRSNGIASADIQLSGMSISNDYYMNSSNARATRGYLARNEGTALLKDLGKLDSLLGALGARAAMNLDSFQYRLSDAEAYCQLALEAALADAATQAEAYLQTLGLALPEQPSVVQIDAMAQAPLPDADLTVSEDLLAERVYESGLVTFTAQVTVTYTY